MLSDGVNSHFFTLQCVWSLAMCLGLIALGLTVAVAVAVTVSYYVYRRLMVRDFERKAVFITGADKGFGRSVVLELDRRGVSVFAGCHSAAGADRLKGEVSDRVRTVVIEVTDRHSVIKAREFIQAHLPENGLWGLVNNAGIARGIFFDFAQVEDYKQVMDVNFFGSLNVTEEFLPLIKKSGGRVVNMISIMGRFTGVEGPYSCSKFALEAYTDGLRRSLNPFGVKVSAIEPGFYRTKMTDRLFIEEEINRLWEELPKHLQEDFGVETKNRALQKFGDFISAPPLSQWNTVEGVASDVVHALGARNPKTRYVCGLDAHLIYRPAAMLPDFLVDAFFPFIGPSSCYVPHHERNSTNTS